MTFSKYKCKALVGILLSGTITSISKLFPGSILDKELTRRSGLIDLLEGGDSVMVDRGKHTPIFVGKATARGR